MTRSGMAATWATTSVLLAAPAVSQSAAEVADLRQIAPLHSRLGQVEAQQQDGAPLDSEPDRVRLTLAGRVNQAILIAGQGGRNEAFVLDNDASGSRFEFQADSGFNEFTTGVEIVVSAEVNSSDEIDFGETLDGEDDDDAFGDFRQAHWFIESERLGYFSIGQGDTAAEDTAHADLSGTDFAGSGSDVDDIAGGLVFTARDGAKLARLDDFFDMQDGSRSLRVLYETPDLVGGLTFVASLEKNAESLNGEDAVQGDGLSPAIGVTFQRAFDRGGEIAAEASWRREEQDEFVAGSASVLLASGLNVTVAASRGDLHRQGAASTAVFAKIGYIANWWDFGETRFSFDYFNGENGLDFASPEGGLPKAKSRGLFAVQEIAALNTEFYAGMRLYELNGVFVDGDENDMDDLSAFITGAMVRF